MKRVTNNLRFVLLTICGVILGVSGCSSSQDGGGGGSPSVQLTGAVIDGPVASGIVWIDANDNGELDTDEREPFARTDIDGYFSRSKDGVNYCGDNDSDNDIYCLRGQANSGDTVTVRVTGGYDVFTGEPFHGTLSFEAEVKDDGTIEEFKVTPITALLTHLGDEDIVEFSRDVAVDKDDLYKDFTDEKVSFEDDKTRDKLFRTALKIQKFLEPIIGQLANAYEDELDAAKEDEKSPFRPEVMYKLAFAKLAEELGKKSPVDLASTLTSDVAEKIIVAVEDTLPGPSRVDAESLGGDAVSIVGAIDRAVSAKVDSSNPIQITDLPTFERVIQVAVDILSESERDEVFNQAISLAANSAYQDKLEVDSVDLKDVKDRIVSDEVTLATIANPGILDYSNRPCLGDNIGDNGNVRCNTAISLKGKKLKIADRNSNDEATLYFLDDTPSGGNRIVVCATSDESRVNFTDEKFKGSWERIPGNDYSAVGSILIGESGTPESFIVTSVNYLNPANVPVDFATSTKWRFRFDFNGELTDYDAKKTGGRFLEDIGRADTGNKDIALNNLTESSIVCPSKT